MEAQEKAVEHEAFLHTCWPSADGKERQWQSQGQGTAAKEKGQWFVAPAAPARGQPPEGEHLDLERDGGRRWLGPGVSQMRRLCDEPAPERSGKGSGKVKGRALERPRKGSGK